MRPDLIKNAPLGTDSWFACGGTAEYLYSPASLEALQNFLKCHPERSEGSHEILRFAQNDITVVGGLANTIIRDGGIKGCVIQLGKNCANIEANDTNITVEAGALNGSIAAAALKNAIGGLEFLSGIPGTLGGAVKMNAGAYGTEMKDVLTEIHLLDLAGNLHVKTPDQLGMTYRYTDIPDNMIIIAATLKGTADNYDHVKMRLNDIKKRRNDTQPIKEKTGGSTFANPSPEELEAANLPHGMRAWEVVARVGGRGLQIGGAQMSEKHCNFMINMGNATSADLENLGDELIRRAREELGLNLRWEIKRVGIP